jgi:uncharacterized membrane protein
MMLWWSNGFWGLGWWLLVAVMGAFMVICMVMMVRMMMRHAVPCFHARRSERHELERILSQRLASGEIGVEEYERLRDALRRQRNRPGDSPAATAPHVVPLLNGLPNCDTR